MDGNPIESVRLVNVPSFLHSIDLSVELPGVGAIYFDVGYGANFYAIIEPQANYAGLHALTPSDIQRLRPVLRARANEKYHFVHPTGAPTVDGANARNAVFYGDKAIDRSPCGTGTSARM